MNEFVEQLISVVAMEAEHCERLLTLLRQQQRHLIEGETDALQANVREQEAAMRRSRDLENRRQALVATIAERQSLDSDTPNLSALIATLSDDYGRRLAALRTSMAQSIERLTKTKEQNKMLIEQSLTNINEIMHMLAAANVAAGEYNGQPNGKATAAPLSVDRVG
jgi:flagellar biosynthesis/type III secretory pathway chaperone